MCSTNFKFLGQVNGNLMGNCDFFIVRNFCQGAAVVISRPGQQETKLRHRNLAFMY